MGKTQVVGHPQFGFQCKIPDPPPTARLHIFTIRHPETPQEREGRENLARVRRWYQTHLGGKQRECAEALGLSVMAVNRHVKALRAEWH